MRPSGGQASHQDVWAQGPILNRPWTCHFQDTAHERVGYVPGVTRWVEDQPLSQPRASYNPLQMYPLVRELAEDGIPVTVTCRVLGFSKQAFYKWRATPFSQRDWDDAHLIDHAVQIHGDDPWFGYRFIADMLAEADVTAGENRGQRLCQLQKIWSVFTKKRGLGKKPGPPVHEDLVDRQFTATSANTVWLTDITEHATAWIPAVVATPRHGGV